MFNFILQNILLFEFKYKYSNTKIYEKYTIFFKYTKIHIRENLVKYTYIHDIGNFYLDYILSIKREGNGEMNYADGSVYSGQWRDDKREGYGRMYYASGSVYEGEWVADKRHGQGVFIWDDYNRYLSDFNVRVHCNCLYPPAFCLIN